METEDLSAYADFGMSLSAPAFTLILIGAALLRLIPLLILVSTVIKLRRFPHLRALHGLLLVTVIFAATLGLIDIVAPGLIPIELRTSGLWAFLWIFAVAWVAVTWTRSAIKTRLRPRVLEIATLVCAAGLVVSLLIPIAVTW